MEELNKLDNYFSLEIANLLEATPKSKEEIEQKTTEIAEAVENYKQLLIASRDTLQPKEFNKINNGFKEDHKNLQEALEVFAKKLIIVSDDEEKYGEVENLKIIPVSLKIHKNTKNPNSYEFPMDSAINCIPDFFGHAEDLTSFIDQINYFYSKMPKGVSHTPLINVIKLKLKGRAKFFANSISNLPWEKVEQNMIEEFSVKKSSVNIFKTISTISQKQFEKFKSYKNRALEILADLESVEDFNKNSLVMKNFKLHFIAGLNNIELQRTARNIVETDFRQFLNTLEHHYVSDEEFEDLQKHVQKMNIQTPTVKTNFRSQFKHYNNNNNGNLANNAPVFRNNYQQNYHRNNDNRNVTQENNRFRHQQQHRDFNQNHSNNRPNQNFNAHRGISSQQNNMSNNSKTYYPQRKN